MKVLIVGSGGREHALAWKIAQSSSLDQLFVLPGNAGTALIANNTPGNHENVSEVVEFVKKENIDLTIVGPEAPLKAGLADALKKEKKLVFGPTAGAARIESSKAFSKELMVRLGVPTGRAKIFSDFRQAQEYILDLVPPIVIKADGLCGGKGVIIAKSTQDALSSAHKIMVEKMFGDAGNKILVEEYLEGEEVSFFALTDGKNSLVLPSAQDYKRAYDGDEGPNTGGMGSHSPCPWMTKELSEHVIDTIIEPIIYGLKKEGYPYQGVLYGGLIKTDGELKVLEFNCRFGDPEAQALLPLIEGDLLGVFASVAEGNLSNAPCFSISEKRAVTVVIASGGYPDKYPTGFEISGLERASSLPETFIFHAGTRLSAGKVVTAGGRVLSVTGLGKTFHIARKMAYNSASLIFFENMHMRKDIGERVM